MLHQTKESLSRAFALLVVTVVSVAALAGCNSDLGIDNQTYQCATDSDCGEGLECRTGQCADRVFFNQLCEAYCGDYMETCNDLVEGPQQRLAGHGECMGMCQAYPINGVEGDESGNSLQCRRHHLELAKVSTPESHCTHASPEGKNFCGDTTKQCLLFCFRVMEHCTGENRRFDTPQTCLGACEGYQAEDTLACRFNYIEDVRQGFEVTIGCENATAQDPICEAR